MLYRATAWTWYHLRPREGWLSFFLLLAAVGCLAGAVVTVAWVPEVNVVAWAAPLALILATILAKRPLRPLAAWLFILDYGLVFTLVYLGRLLPSVTTVAAGQGGVYFRQQWALLFDRLAGWFIAVGSGERTTETVVFAALLGLGSWLLAAYAAWSTYRQRQPLVALSLMGVALALNTFYGGRNASLSFVAAFIGVTILLASTVHYASMEYTWEQTGVDYSREIRIEQLTAAAAVAIFLMAAAFVLPVVRFSAIARAFQESGAVQQAESAMERAFAGVRQPPRAEPAYVVGGTGVLPRSFLLGNAPTLYETVMMTATVRPLENRATHWRAASYDVYTGRGWALSDERRETIAAQETIVAPPPSGQEVFTQTVHWLFDERTIRYTLGFPLAFDQEVTAYWRGVADFSRATGATTGYSARSSLTTAGATALRQAALADVPPLIFSRYTQLPESTSQRVRDLALEIAGNLATPYDQARALEMFLRQYPYSLEVPPPPADEDPVDFFLFDLQQGYCDYYASAMVVMARSLGIPARLATGYLAQAPDPSGVQTIYQINAHAWAEVYFAGYGWVEFEPTASFSATTATTLPAPEETDPLGATPTAAAPPPPIPPPAPGRISPLWVIPLIALVLAAWTGWHLVFSRRRESDPILSAYARLLRSARRLGQPTPAAQTPAEFQTALLARLDRWESHRWLARWLRGVRPAIVALTTFFVTYQYSRVPRLAATRARARAAWRTLAPRLWLLRLLATLHLIRR
jgi:transglutaminase-like putative cysteine protease